MVDTIEHKLRISCPSSPCEEGAILLGIVQGDGHVSIASERLLIDSEFVKIAHLGRKPEKRFRFAGECVASNCMQWENGRCGVIDKVIEILNPNGLPDSLPDCSIRPECRWYKQCGSRACVVCPEVITNLT